jgi:hypothetical protein
MNPVPHSVTQGNVFGIGTSEGKLGNSNKALIRHDYKRACYRAMLAEFTAAEVAEFFAKAPLIMEGKEIKGPELFKLLWSDKAKIPIYWDYFTDTIIEAFLIEKGRDVQTVLRKILWLHNQSTYIPGKVLLTWFYPRLEALFDSIDTRDMVFTMVTLFTENWLPNHIHRRIKRWEDGDWVRSVLVYISDSTFKEFLDWDYEFIAGPQIISAPIMFGMSPFEEFGMISDTRPPRNVIWDPAATVSVEGTTMKIAGEAFGKRMAFSDFCIAREFDLSKFNPPDFEVTVMERDYICPIRKRAVLHKDCAYGAPVFMGLVSHRKLKFQQKGFLNLFIGDIEREESLQKDALEPQHAALMAFAAGSAEFKYHVSDESMTLNGQHFTKGVPAQILKHLLSAWAGNGRTDFEYRELKQLFEISQGQKNSNFEVRFYRLVDKLKEECPTISIEKTGRGKFSLIVHGDLTYEEC